MVQETDSLIMLKELRLTLLGMYYIADTDNHRVQKFNSTGTYITQWGTNGTGDGQFKRPSGIAVDPSGNIFVAEREGNRIQKFTNAGTLVIKWGSSGTGSGQFDSPSDMAIDGSSNIYVTDKGNHRIQKFSNTGTYITIWGNTGTTDGTFKYPHAIEVDGSGNVLVTDQDNHRCQKFSNTGTFYLAWGNYGTGNGQMEYPQGITIDASDNIYVVDYLNSRIEKFDNIAMPDIAVKQLGSTIANNGTFDFNYVASNTNSGPITFTIENSSPGTTINLTGATSKITISGTNASSFTINESSTSETLMEGSPTTFTIVFTPSGLGEHTAVISIDNDDPDEAPYVINLVGYGDVPNAVSNKAHTIPVQLYPNPSDGIFMVESNEANMKITLTNAYGVQEYHEGKEINTEMRGLIMVEIKTDKGAGYSKIIIK
jgi:hypothetical protein